MSETASIILVVIILLGVQFLISKIRKPLVYILRIGAGLVALGMFWFLSENPRIPVLVIMTAVIVSSMVKNLIDLRKSESSVS